MNGWTLRVELALASLGRWPVVLGLVALLACALWMVVLPAGDQRVQHERRQLATLTEQAAAPAAAPAAPPADPLATFESRLAGPDDVTNLMVQVWKLGADAGLQMNKVDYRTEPDPGGGFERLSVTLPMTGAYPAVRRFVFSLMAEYPGLSLDKLDMKREQTAHGRVETTVHLTLLTRP
jgi:hypothetical protein